MSVSYPKGSPRPVLKTAPMASMPSAPSAPTGMSRPHAPVPAGTGATPGAKPTTGHFGNAMTHHGHLGAALKSGDASAAMKHVGHILRAVRSNQSAPNSANTAVKAPPAAAPSMGEPPSSDGTDEWDDDATTVTSSAGPTPSPTAKKPGRAFGRR